MTDEQLRSLLIYSFRYALGKKTYATYDVAEIIKQSHMILSSHDKLLLIDDIKRAISLGQAGMDYDIQVWEELKTFLEKV